MKVKTIFSVSYFCMQLVNIYVISTYVVFPIHCFNSSFVIYPCKLKLKNYMILLSLLT